MTTVTRQDSFENHRAEFQPLDISRPWEYRKADTEFISCGKQTQGTYFDVFSNKYPDNRFLALCRKRDEKTFFLISLQHDLWQTATT